MSLVNIDLKSAGVDPAKIQDIEAQLDTAIKRANWLLACAEVFVKAFAALVHIELPPDPQ